MSDRRDLNREAEADAALRHTEVTTRTAAAVCGLFLATLAVVPLLSAWPLLARRETPVQLARSPQMPAAAQSAQRRTGLLAFWTEVPDPAAIRAFEDRVTRGTVLSRWLRPPAQWFLTAALGVGSEEVYKGTGAWLFYRPDVDYITGPGFLASRTIASRRQGDPNLQPDPVLAIVDFQRQLAGRGIRLLVLPAPSKAAILPGRLGPRSPAAGPLQNPSYALFLKRLRDHGVPVFDPSAVLIGLQGGPTYLEGDTHWTPAGMEAAAAGAAAVVRPWLPVPDGSTSGARYVRRRAVVSNEGDITAMLQLPRGQRRYRAQTVTIHPVTDGGRRLWSVDRQGDVLLLGDSFSNIYSAGAMGWGTGAGLAEQLSYLLQRPVDRIAVNAGGAFGSRERLVQSLRRGEDRLAGKRVVIWEFADRDLASGDWKLLSLPAPAPGRKPALPQPAGVLTVTGVIRSISRPPAPGTAPYRDCLIAIRLSAIRAFSGHVPAGDVLVYVWGLRDNVLTPAASYAIGQSVTLTLVPWSQAEDRYGSVNRRELDDPDSLDLAPYWGEIARAE